MPDVHTQDCPLCQSPAKYEFHNFDQLRFFRCSQCPDYVISIGAEDRLRESPVSAQWKEALLQKARLAGDDRVLLITLSSRPKQEGMANPVFDEEFVARTSFSK